VLDILASLYLQLVWISPTHTRK